MTSKNYFKISTQKVKNLKKMKNIKILLATALLAVLKISQGQENSTANAEVHFVKVNNNLYVF